MRMFPALAMPATSQVRMRDADRPPSCLILGIEMTKSVKEIQMQESQQELYRQMLAVALDEARLGHAEGGIPVGAALFTRTGELLSRGHNRRVQEGDPSIH